MWGSLAKGKKSGSWEKCGSAGWAWQTAAQKVESLPTLLTHSSELHTYFLLRPWKEIPLREMLDLSELTPRVAIKVGEALKCQTQDKFLPPVLVTSVLVDSCRRHPLVGGWGGYLLMQLNKGLPGVPVWVDRSIIPSGKGRKTFYILKPTEKFWSFEWCLMVRTWLRRKAPYRKKKKKAGFSKPILWGLLLCDFFFFLLNNLLHKMGTRKGKGNLQNTNWPLGARTD